MELVIIALPTVTCSLVVVDSESSETVFSTQCWFNDIVPTVRQITENYNIEKTLIYGPINYTTKFKEMIEPIINNIELQEE